MERQVSLNIACDTYTPIEDSLGSRYIAERYNFSLSDCEIIDEKIESFIDLLKSKYNNLKVTFLDCGALNKTYIIESESNFYLEGTYAAKTKYYNFTLFTTDAESLPVIYEYIKKYEIKDNGLEMEVDFYYLDSRGELQVSKDYKTLTTLPELSKSYYPYLNTDILFKKYMISDEPILLLVGPTGLGKTKLVGLFERYLFEHPENVITDMDDEEVFKVAYVKNEEILAKDSFWNTIDKMKYTFIFLDDADDCLMGRDEEIATQEDVNRKKFISHLLTYTDGLDKNKTKFLLTTNKSITSIDKAILRRGRTFDILALQPLSYDEALTLWLEEGLSKEQYDTIFNDKKEITASDLGSEINMAKKLKELNETIGDYILRPNVSLLHEYKNKTNKIKF